jgi:hypothetical protein
MKLLNESIPEIDEEIDNAVGNKSKQIILSKQRRLVFRKIERLTKVNADIDEYL